MPVAQRILMCALVMAIFGLLSPAVHAQQIQGPQVLTTFVAPESFWVKRLPSASMPISKIRKHTASRADGVGKIQEIASRVDQGAGGNNSIAQAIEANRSVPWSIVLGLTLLTLLPALLLSITPMVRLLVVFHFLRQALGTQTAPSNQILMGLALMMTWFLMQPVLQNVEQVAIAPYQAGAISGMDAMQRGLVPVKQYMLRYARDKDLEVFAAAGIAEQPKSREDLPIQVVVPAYILSELKAGFQIGAILFLPFLLVDLVVASVTTSVGMMQLPPVVISTPLKILLFVMVDGWNLLAHQLIKSF